MRDWRITLVRAKGQYLGRVEGTGRRDGDQGRHRAIRHHGPATAASAHRSAVRVVFQGGSGSLGVPLAPTGWRGRSARNVRAIIDQGWSLEIP